MLYPDQSITTHAKLLDVTIVCKVSVVKPVSQLHYYSSIMPQFTENLNNAHTCEGLQVKLSKHMMTWHLIIATKSKTGSKYEG